MLVGGGVLVAVAMRGWRIEDKGSEKAKRFDKIKT